MNNFYVNKKRIITSGIILSIAFGLFESLIVTRILKMLLGYELLTSNNTRLVLFLFPLFLFLNVIKFTSYILISKGKN